MLVWERKTSFSNSALVCVGGWGVEAEFTMVFFTASDGLQKNLCAFIFAHSSGSDLLYNYITFYLLRPAFPALLPLAASSLVPVTLSLKGFQVSDVEIKKKREMVGDAVRITASAFLFFSPLSLFTLFI